MSTSIVHAKTDSPVAESSLTRGVPRFLSHVMEHALLVNRRKPDDFLRHFTPHTIMTALAEEADLRATILEPTTGVRRKVGLRKSPGSAADDLSFALDERETDAAAVLTYFRADDRVRNLPASAVWAFVSEGVAWQTPAREAGERSSIHRHLAFLLAQALENELITPRDIFESIGAAALAEHLPKHLLADVMGKTLEAARKGQSFGDVEFLATLPPMTLVEHLPHPLLWEKVIVPHLEQRHQLHIQARQEAKAPIPPAESPAAIAEPPAVTKTDVVRTENAKNNGASAQPPHRQSPKLSLRTNANGNSQSAIEHGAPTNQEAGKAAKPRDATTELQDLVDDAFDSLQG